MYSASRERYGIEFRVGMVALLIAGSAAVPGTPLLAAPAPTNSAEFAENTSPVRLRGEWCQGHLLRGQAEPGSRAWLNDRALEITPDGRFVFGFGRDEAARQTLKVQRPNGETWRHADTPCAREYRIQRIDGLPPSKVTPDESVLARIREEGAQAAAARKYIIADEAVFADFIWPSRGPISGVYGSQRILNGQPRRPHFGVDVAAPTGTTVVAPAAGIVRLAHPDMYFSGGTLIIDHGYGVTSSFLHLSRIDVEVGQQVEQGDKIAEIGATGRVTGPHLDWRMNWRDVRVDPQPLVGPMPD